MSVEVTDNSEAFLENTLNILETFLRRVCEKIIHDAQDIIKTGQAFATGEMYKNLRYDVYRAAAQIIGVVGSGANVPYTIFRHQGTRPHFPPIEPIKNWVIKKGFLSDKKGHSIRSVARIKKSVSYDAQATSIAYAIAKTIAKKGTKGLPFLTMALNQNVSWIASEVQKLQAA